MFVSLANDAVRALRARPAGAPPPRFAANRNLPRNR
jgi:hypothetical protein